MKTIKKVSKAQVGRTVKQSNADMMKEIAAREKRIAARDSANQRKSYTNERANKVVGKNKMGGTTKAKNGKSFPDLNKDRKITKADILKGRGVIAKKGMKVKKAQPGVTIKSKNVDDSGKVTGGMFAPKPYKIDVDTSGYSAGKKKFPATLRTQFGKDQNINEAKPSKTTVKRKVVDKAIGKNKTGGKTKKCKYGCK